MSCWNIARSSIVCCLNSVDLACMNMGERGGKEIFQGFFFLFRGGGGVDGGGGGSYGE